MMNGGPDGPEKEYGAGINPEISKSVEASSRQVKSCMEAYLGDAGRKGPEEAAKAAEIWRDFTNNLFARTMSENLHDPQKVEVALQLANALLQPEPNEQGRAAAVTGIEELKKRYGI